MFNHSLTSGKECLRRREKSEGGRVKERKDAVANDGYRTTGRRLGRKNEGKKKYNIKTKREREKNRRLSEENRVCLK